MEKRETVKKKKNGGLLKFIVFVVIVALVVILLVKINNDRNTETNTANNSPKVNFTTDVTLDENEVVSIVNEKMQEERVIKGLKFKNAKFVEKIGQSELTVEVTNDTNEKIDGFLINVVLLNKDGEELGSIPASVIDVEAGEMIRVRAAITEKYVGVYDYKIVER